jgi:hypothetical protein
MVVPVGPWATGEPLYLGEAVPFGDAKQRAQKLYLSIDDLTRHKVCIGGSGCGKSTEARNELDQHADANRGHMLIDAQDLAREHLANLAERSFPGRVTPQAQRDLGNKLIVIEPAATHRLGWAPGYNFLAPRPGLRLHEIVDNAANLLFELWRGVAESGARMVNISRLTLQCLAENGLTLAEAPLFLTDHRVRHLLVRRCRSDQVKQFFVTHLGGLRPGEVRVWLESSQNKWSSLITPNVLPIVGQRRSTFSFDEALNGKIVLVNLSRNLLKTEQRAVLGGLCISEIHRAAVARENTPPERRYFFAIVVDEAQDYWTETMAEILEAGRKYGLSLNLYFQSTRQRTWAINPGSIDNVMANCHTRLVFSVAAQDAQRLAPELFQPLGDCIKFQGHSLGIPVERPTFYSVNEEYQNCFAELMHQQVGCCYASFKGLSHSPVPYQLMVPYRPPVRTNPQKIAALLEHVGHTYGRPVDVVTREIDERWARLRAEAAALNEE